MAMAEQRPDSSYFQTTHSRVDSKLYSDSSEKLGGEATYGSLERPILTGLRRCAATRDLTRQDYTPNTGTEKTMDFRLNVCHTVLQKDLDVKNPDDIAAWGKKIKGSSLGKLSQNPFFKGDSLLLEYKDGDECPNAQYYKKSTLIRFVCDSSVKGQGTPYLIANNNDCNFWFEWHTPAACATDRPSGGSTGGVFGTIIGVAVFVYFVGGIAYNRIVHHARGLKQIPNYQSWVDGFDFVKDMAIILFAKCYRPKRSQTYHNLPVDSEINTLIDDEYEDDEV